MSPDGETLPRFQNWSLTFERRLTKNMMLDVSYIGNHGSRLNHHAQRAGLDYNMNDPAVLSLGAALLNSNINSPAAQAGRDPDSLPGLQRNRGPGAAEVSPVPEHRMAGSSRSGGASTTPLEVVLEQHLSERAPVPRRLHLLPAEEQRRGERAGQRGDQRRRPGSRQLGHRRLRAQPGRHAARAPGGLHLGHRVRRFQELDGGQEGPPRRLEPQRNPALRERPASAHHHGQRHGRLCSSTPRSARTARRPMR